MLRGKCFKCGVDFCTGPGRIRSGGVEKYFLIFCLEIATSKAKPGLPNTEWLDQILAVAVITVTVQIK